jgi:hypothetical protein
MLIGMKHRPVSDSIVSEREDSSPSLAHTLLTEAVDTSLPEYEVETWQEAKQDRVT